MTTEQQALKVRFLEPETRCGHYVNAETKACWKAMLDMVEELDRICRKYDIKYFLIAGSLLGAIRHKGFIPWDDDVDIALFRHDYDRLEKILPKELPSNMFMQTMLTDSGYETAHMKIRLAGTAAILRGAIQSHRRYNMGLFVDVFALDGVPRTNLGKKILTKIGEKWREFVSCHTAWTKQKCRRWKLKKLFYDIIWGIFGTRIIYLLREWCFARVKIRPDGDCVQAPCEWGYDQRYRYPVALLQNVIDMPFEYLTLKVPEKYNEVLTQTYGNWHEIVKGGSAHTIVAMSLSESYKNILVDRYGYTAR
jgi:lipopolysaccharide cholinephosphotransferase